MSATGNSASFRAKIQAKIRAQSSVPDYLAVSFCMQLKPISEENISFLTVYIYKTGITFFHFMTNL